jgi:5-oxopent-3-ene-1,2,5-tricarboxylate decarboxylase / 2-hydroxyhepta-2,4-diene-1,7-dioate isomerase
MYQHPIVKGKLVCVALNDQKQLDAMQSVFEQAPYKKIPSEPVLYFKPRNTWCGDDENFITDSDVSLFVGASLAVVISKECCRVSEDTALDYVGSYSILHDVSGPEDSYYRPDIKGKCMDGSAVLSHNAIPASNIADPNALTVITRINGEVKAEFKLTQMHRNVQQVIEKVSHIMTLDAADVIAVGFAGTRQPVSNGDKVVSSIEGVGSLTTFIGGNE